jgi:Haem-binding domain
MVKKILKITILVLALAFIAIQFIRPDRTNPPEVPGETLEASTRIPADVGAILSRSCADCHSNRTIYPWYSNIAPVSWLLADHIRDGRRELNLSIWNTYDNRRKGRKLDEICDQVETGEMPLPSYLWIHWDAALKEGEAAKICDWTKAEKERLQPQ